MEKETTFFKQILLELIRLRKVKNQFEFGEKLGYTSGHMTTLIKKDIIAPNVQQKLYEVFGITKEYLVSNGTHGTMFPPAYRTDQPPTGMVNESGSTYGEFGDMATVNEFIAKLKENPLLLNSEEGKKELDNINLVLYSQDTKTNQPMISRILSIMEMQNANMQRVATAVESVSEAAVKTADANQTLARTVEHLSRLMGDGDSSSKRKAS